MSDATIQLLLADRHSIAVSRQMEEIFEAIEALYPIQLELQTAPWDQLRSTLIRTAAQKYQSHIAEIGSTWQDSLVAMNALRIFSERELNSFGGKEAFIPSLWQISAQRYQDVYSIPWMAGTRAIFFWQDILEDCGIDAETAFLSSAHMEETFARLQSAGFETPWGFTTSSTHENALYILSWIWEAGGDIRTSPDGKMDWLTPGILEGLEAYFRLGQFISPDQHPIEFETVVERFENRQYAAVMTGPWALQNIAPDLIDRVGIASPPAHAFVGSDNLIIWSHASARDRDAMLNVIAYLVSPEVQRVLPGLIGLLPARQDVFGDIQFPSPFHAQTLLDIMSNGRPFPSLPLGGRIEGLLTSTIGRLWNEYFQKEQELPDLLEQSLISLNKQVNLMLA